MRRSAARMPLRVGDGDGLGIGREGAERGHAGLVRGGDDGADALGAQLGARVGGALGPAVDDGLGSIGGREPRPVLELLDVRGDRRGPLDQRADALVVDPARRRDADPAAVDEAEAHVGLGAGDVLVDLGVGEPRERRLARDDQRLGLARAGLLGRLDHALGQPERLLGIAPDAVLGAHPITPTRTLRNRPPETPWPTCPVWPGLALAAVRGAPHAPARRVADGVHRAPQLVRDAGVGAVPVQLAGLAALDLAADLGRELEVEAPVVDRPAAVGLEQQAVVRVGDDVVEAHAVAGQQVDVGHADERDSVPAVGPHRAARPAPDPGRRLARAEVPDEHPVLDQVDALGLHALVVPAERAEAARDRRVGDDVDEVGSVAEAVQHVGREEARAGVAGLGAERAVELGGVPAALVDLHVELARVQEDRARARGERRRAQQLDGLARDPLGVALEVHAAHELVARRRPEAAVVGEAAALVLVARDGVGLEAGADVGDRLLGVAAVARGERLPLALGRVQALGEGDAADLVHLAVGGQEVRDLPIERDPERVLVDGRLERAVRRRPVVEPDGGPQGGRAGLRDADGLGGGPVGLGGREMVARGEAPGPVDEHPDAEPLGLARLHALDAGGLDVDRFLDPPDHANVRVARAQGGGRVEGTGRQIAHRPEGSKGRFETR